MKLDEKIDVKNLAKRLKGISIGTLMTAIAALSVDQQRTLQLLISTALRTVGEDKKPIKLKPLIEDVIGKVSQRINIVIQLDKTKHAGDQQSRHEDHYISNAEIKMVAEKAVEKVSKMLLFDKIDVGDHILIRDRRTNLNLVGHLKQKGGELELIIITVMVKKDFKPKPGTKVVDI